MDNLDYSFFKFYWECFIFLPAVSLIFIYLTDYGSSVGSGSVVLDDCNFHESVRLDSFDVDKTLTLVSEAHMIDDTV